MNIITVDNNNKQAFEAYISSHSRRTFLQSWAWGQWQIAQGRSVERFLITEGITTLGAAQMITIHTPMGTYLYCPYGPLWNETLTEQQAGQLLRELVSYLKNKFNIFFVRVEPTLTCDLRLVGARRAESVQPPQTLITNITPDEQTLLHSFHYKTRYNIRVAQKHSVSVDAYSKPQTAIIDLIEQTAQRQSYRNHSRQYIQSMWEFFNADNTEITVTGYLASKDTVPLASSIMVDYANTRMYLFGGSDYAHRSFMAPFILHWQAMLDAKKKGFTQYDFGASENASGQTGGYMRFKLGFNAQVINFTGTHDFPLKRAWYTIYTFIRTLNRIRLHRFITKQHD